jgi:hypothetical protein
MKLVAVRGQYQPILRMVIQRQHQQAHNQVFLA